MVFVCGFAVILMKSGNFLLNMYYKDIESNKELKKQHDDNLKRNAADRLRALQEKRRWHRKNGQKDA